MGLTVDQETHIMHITHAHAYNKTTPTNIYIYFFAEFHKNRGPAGSEKQVINLVWP